MIVALCRAGQSGPVAPLQRIANPYRAGFFLRNEKLRSIYDREGRFIALD